MAAVLVRISDARTAVADPVAPCGVVSTIQQTRRVILTRRG
jgi:hypothetical protein